jgi:apolipoprotein N-acyltransferase
MEVLIVQPNIDPYNKFQALTQRQQDAILIQQIEESLEDRHVRNISDQEQSPLLIVAPETFTSPLFTESIHENTTWRSFVHLLKSYPNVNMLFGASAYDHIQSYKAPSATARHIRENLWLESHNSALNIDGKGRTDLYHKSKLVVAVEMTPYPAIFCKLDDMLGGVMGRCIGQDEVTLMQHTSYDNEGHISKTIPYGSAICYESVYGDYYADYVEKGARFMTIITNDAWWGDTPGYKQHLSYASLRAIETRRSIARCANTGLSAIINQRGEITAKTNWWKQETLRGTINMNDEITFFTKYGDIIGRVCTFLFALLLLSLAVRFRKR